MASKYSIGAQDIDIQIEDKSITKLNFNLTRNVNSQPYL